MINLIGNFIGNSNSIQGGGDWILSDGTWNDSKVWDDSAVWID